MKFFFNPILVLLIIFSYEKSAYSLSDNQIKQRCLNKLKRTTCIKNLKSKKLDLLQGEIIEIPVIPFKR